MIERLCFLESLGYEILDLRYDLDTKLPVDIFFYKKFGDLSFTSSYDSFSIGDSDVGLIFP